MIDEAGLVVGRTLGHDGGEPGVGDVEHAEWRCEEAARILAVNREPLADGIVHRQERQVRRIGVAERLRVAGRLVVGRLDPPVEIDMLVARRHRQARQRAQFELDERLGVVGVSGRT